MWNIDRSTETIFSNSVGEHRGGFAGVISIAALITGLFLATATYALAAPADSNTVAGVDGTPGINWVTLHRRPTAPTRPPAPTAGGHGCKMPNIPARSAEFSMHGSPLARTGAVEQGGPEPWNTQR